MVYEQIDNGVKFICCKCHATVYTDIHTIKRFGGPDKNNLICLTCKGNQNQMKPNELWNDEPRIDVECTDCGRKFSVLAELEKTMNLSLYVCESCKRKERYMMDLTDKQLYVVGLLDKNVNMPTKDIIADYNECMEGGISPRHVQRVRKWYKANNVESSKGEENMNQEDVFNASNAMSDWQIEVLNMANEGGWSIQQLSEKFGKEDTDIKKTLIEFGYLVSSQILDENSDNPYFEIPTIPENQNLLPEPGPESSNRYFDELPKEEKVQGEPEVNKSASNDDYWEVKIDCVTACSKAKKEVDVFLNKIARDKAMSFMKWAKAREWLAYLIGEKKDDDYYVYDLYLPDQRTSQVLVDKVVAENYNQMKVIGVIHSHHEMGAGDEDSPSFSGHDTEFINGNHNLSLLAGRKNGNGFTIVGIARVKTPCNALIKVKANVKALVVEPTDEEIALQDEFFSKVFNKSPKKNGKENSTDGSYHFTNDPQLGQR